MAKSKLVGLLGALVLAALVVLPVRAAEAPPQPYVVVVGIDKYKDPQILPRTHAEADARAVYDLLRNKDYLGVDADHVRLLLGSAEAKGGDNQAQPATHANILKALHWAADKARADDPVLFFFFGQGAPLFERTCYFAVDSTFKKRAKDAVAAGEIEVALGKLKSQRFCAFLDVNFKGFDAGKEKPPEVDTSKLYREYLGKEDAAGGQPSRVLFLANNGLKPPIDLKDHGLFATVLLEGLKGKADTAGYEPDGLVTVEELGKFLPKASAALAKEHGKTDEDKKQKAIAIEGQSSNFVLTHNPAAMPAVEKRLARLAELAKNRDVSGKIAAEGKRLLSKMPKLEAQQALRKAYQKLADGKVQAKEFLKDRSAILAKTRLSEEEALVYATTIIQATRLVRAGYVKDINQGQLVDWGVKGLYKRLEEKVPADVKDRLAGVKTLRESELRRLLADVRQQLGKREDLNKGKDVTYTLYPMLAHLDKHTDYITPEQVEQFRIETQAEFYGIGAHIRMNPTKDMLQIVTTIMGSPAYRAKLYAGDIITTIIREVDSDGNPLAKPEVISTKGMPTEKAVKLIKGKAGTRVKLLVEREGEKKPLEFEITRGRVEIETVMGYKRNKDHRWNFYVDPESKIAYIRLSQFSRSTFRDLRLAMKKLSRTGINGLVLDLRFNPGGLLDSAVKVSDLFIDDGVIVSIRPRRGQETVYIGKHEESYLDFPMVCLINDNSASGSEIVSACLQDHHRAIIMGERSYGKGSVQNIQPFDATGGQIKLTTASFWRPNGKNLNKPSTKGRDEDEWGVTPDKGYTLKLPIKEQDGLFDFQREQEIIQRPDYKPKKERAEFKDRQLEMALKYLRTQINTAAKAGSKKKAG